MRKRRYSLAVLVAVVLYMLFNSYMNRENNIKKELTACLNDEANSCHKVGDFYAQKKQFKTAIPYFAQACDLNHYESCNTLSTIYQNALGVDQDLIKSAELLHKSCDGGSYRGCAVLGLIYLEGNGVAKDEFLAKKYFDQACNEKEKRGCFGYGQYYQNKEKPDNIKAYRYHKLSCDAGEKVGCFFVKMYKMQKVNADLSLEKNNDHVETLCEQGLSTACRSIAESIELSEEKEKNKAKIKSYYQKACRFGDKESCSRVR